ncbi:TPA: hypothetical protein N0F65_000604 [Lagenidium giganteum]|uniref:Uncharacterized protein n=1 Tax=Lagenidium giganteum TaxID=4803 RepID=A0AAV2YIJ1_9STRA|nr:TPA: hypothetical protein N0F65_000604 [Lagenidium giganteum]
MAETTTTTMMMKTTTATARSITLRVRPNGSAQRERTLTLAVTDQAGAFAGLLQRAADLAGLPATDCTLKYVDSDGDHVTVASAADLHEMVEYMEDEGITALDVLVKTPTNAMHDMVAAVTRFAVNQLDRPFVKKMTVALAMDTLTTAVRGFEVAPDATALLLVKEDLLLVLTDAELRVCLQTLGDDSVYKDLIQELLTAMIMPSAAETVERVLADNAEIFLQLAKTLVRRCPALKPVLLRIAQNGWSALAQYNKMMLEMQVTVVKSVEAEADLTSMELPTNDESKTPVVHMNIVCDGCEAAPIAGVRYKSAVTPNFDLCEKCEQAGSYFDEHGPFVKLPVPSYVVDITKATASVKDESQITGAQVTDEAKAEGVVHHNFECDGCQMHPIVGPRYRSVKSANMDLCVTCFKTGEHSVSGPFVAVVTEQPIHYNVACDGCDAFPIVGVRYKAFNVPNFDLCEYCEASKKWEATHEPFVKITEPSHAPAPKWTAPIVHPFVACDGCEASPIVGVRYKSAVTRDFDLCESCEASGSFNSSHAPFLKVITPGCVPEISIGYGKFGKHRRGGRGCRPRCAVPTSYTATSSTTTSASTSTPTTSCSSTSLRPRRRGCREVEFNACFLEDVTLVDGSVVEAGSALVKAWRLSNSGSATWPEGCYLGWEGGSLELPADVTEHVPLPALRPGEEHVAEVVLMAPALAGPVSSYWRVFDPSGRPFGHRFWADVLVGVGLLPGSNPGEVTVTKSEEETAGVSPPPSTDDLADMPELIVCDDEVPVVVAAEADTEVTGEDAEVTDAGEETDVDDATEEDTATVDSDATTAEEVEEADDITDSVVVDASGTLLDMLSSMGFTDVETNRRLLDELRGDVERVVNSLLSDTA